MRVLLTLFLAVAFCTSVQAQVAAEHEDLEKQALALFEDGSFQEAFPMYSQLVSLYPKDANFNYRFGTCALLGGEDKSTAIKHLNFGAQKGADVEAHYYLGLAYHRNYDFEKALDAYQEFQIKADDDQKKLYPASRQMAMCKNGEGLLSTLVDVVVLDKKKSSMEDFFRYYDLENIGGKMLTTPEDLLTKSDKKLGHTGIIHFPTGSTMVYFSSYGKDGSQGTDIYQAKLVEGEFTDIEKVSGKINTSHDEDFPFMHPDGKTIYFASKGHNSMGGFDIFSSVFNENKEEWGAPKNMDFAINTPDDDLFYVADSLNQHAFFASARSSALGELHVYEVMVKGIPMNLIFLQGSYASEIDPEIKSAKITVIDELSGRPITETETSEYTGEYLISLPKAGLYTIQVEAENSMYRHEGKFEVPIVDASLAFAQELKLVEESGQEQLIINNFFQAPLDINVASMSQDFLRRQAELEINATEERITQANEAQVSEGGEAQAHLAAGFGTNDSPESIIGDSRAAAADMESEAQRLRSAAENARDLAAYYQSKGSAALADAQRIDLNANPADQQGYLKSMEEYASAYGQADQALGQSRTAYGTAGDLESQATRLENLASEIRKRSDQTETAIAAGDNKTATKNFRWEKDRRNDLKAAETTPATAARETALGLQQQQAETLDELSTLNKTQDERLRKIRRLEGDLETTAKQSDKDEISKNLNTVKIQYAAGSERVEAVKTRVTALSAQEMDLLSRADLYEALQQEGGVPFPEDMADYATVSETTDEGLSALEQTFSRLDPADDSVVAVGSEETRDTRNDITLIPAISARAESMNVELVGLGVLNKRATPYLQAWDGDANDYDRMTALETVKRDLDREVLILENSLPQLQSDGDRKSVTSELSALGSLSAEIEEQLALSDEVTSADASTLRATMERFNPDYASEMQALADEDMSEIERSLRKDALKRNSLRALESELYTLQQDFVSSTKDEGDRGELRAQIDEVKSSLKTLSQEVDDVTDLQVAYETESKSIVESDENFRLKLEEQINLTEQYRQALEATKADRQNRLERTSDSNRRARLETAIAKLEDELSNAETKLETYRSDLELAVSVNDDPSNDSLANDSFSFTPEERRELQLSIYPPFDTEVAANKAAGDRAAVISSHEDLIARVDREIAAQAGLKAALTDDYLRSEIDIEIAALEDLRSATSEALAAIEADADFAETNDENTSGPEADANASAADSDVSPSIESVNDLVVAPMDSEEGTSPVRQQWARSVGEREDIENPEYENTHIIDGLSAELQSMTRDLDDVEKKGERKKMQREMNKIRFDIAEEELMHQDDLATQAAVAFNGNEEILEQLEQKYAAKLDAVPEMRDQLDDLRRDARVQYDEAEILRTQGRKIAEEIPRNAHYNEAREYEIAALRDQEDAMAIFGAFEALEYPDQPGTDTAAGEEIVSTENETSTQPASETSDTTPDEDFGDADIALSLEELLPEVEQSTFTPIEVDGSLNDWAASRSIDIEAVESLSAEPGIAEIEEAMLASESAAERVNALRQERATLQARVNTLRSRIFDLDAATITAEDEEANREERTRLLDAAEILYNRLAEIDAELGEAEGELVTSQNDVEIRLAAANIVGRLKAETATDETTTDTEGSDGDNDTAGSDGASDASGDETGDNTGSVDDDTSLAAETNPTTSRPGPETPADFSFSGAIAALLAVPDILETPIFAITDAAIYDENNRIPVDIELPRGVIYKVQVGAFRNDIPQNLFKGFAPIHGESLNNGITRYTAGLFLQFNTADQAKAEIRNLGYSDAFVVAFRDGQRISLAEARGDAGEAIADSGFSRTGSDSEAVDGNNNGSESADAGSDNTTSSTDDSSDTAASGSAGDDSTDSSADNSTAGSVNAPQPLNGNYAENPGYNEAPGAVAATPVEQISGSFYTVQVGVYSQPITSGVVTDIRPLNTELLSNGTIRYTTGQFSDLTIANTRKENVRGQGISDAFVTAYINGKRVPVSQARGTLGSGTITASPIQYEVLIGSFLDQVPATVAQAMLLLEGEFGIQQREVNGRTEYFTNRVNSRDAAEAIRDAFKSRGVEGTLIQEIGN